MVRKDDTDVYDRHSEKRTGCYLMLRQVQRSNAGIVNVELSRGCRMEDALEGICIV